MTACASECPAASLAPPQASGQTGTRVAMITPIVETGTLRQAPTLLCSHPKARYLPQVLQNQDMDGLVLGP